MSFDDEGLQPRGEAMIQAAEENGYARGLAAGRALEREAVLKFLRKAYDEAARRSEGQARYTLGVLGADIKAGVHAR